MESILIFTNYILQSGILIITGLSTLYLLVFATAGLFYRQAPSPGVTRFRRIAVLIPGYREDDVIVEVAKDALLQEYPAGSYDVVVIADSFRPETLARIRELKIKVIEVAFEKSTKAKALNKAMEQLETDYDLAVVLDADNLMARDFLARINAAFERDILAVQGHRKAKNMNTSLAVLDSISEEINNHIFRKGHRVLGFSSAIIGSGMAFRYGYFRELMSGVNAVGGFDKEIELKMMKAGHAIEYLNDAVVYDEKVQKAEVFSNQRRRWLSAQFYYFRKDALDSFRELMLRGNLDYFDKILQFIQPPRILLAGSIVAFGMFFSVVNYLLGISFFNIIWAGVSMGCLLALFFSVPAFFYTGRTLRSVASLPRGLVLMLGAMFSMKGANRQFIHTQHGTFEQDKRSLKKVQ